jgi:hypothetical protein
MVRALEREKEMARFEIMMMVVVDGLSACRVTATVEFEIQLITQFHSGLVMLPRVTFKPHYYFHKSNTKTITTTWEAG